MRDPDWLIENGFEIQADVEARDSDLRDATFLAPRRTMDAADTRTPEERERDRARVAEVDAWHTRQKARPWTPRLRCDDCGLASCDGGPGCRGDMR